MIWYDFSYFYMEEWCYNIYLCFNDDYRLRKCNDSLDKYFYFDYFVDVFFMNFFISFVVLYYYVDLNVILYVFGVIIGIWKVILFFEVSGYSYGFFFIRVVFWIVIGYCIVVIIIYVWWVVIWC